jgi:hypothetical protein
MKTQKVGVGEVAVTEVALFIFAESQWMSSNI